MEDLLLKMPSDKRERLINSALQEFGENKFDKASTNAIVKKAGISKGLLYHYFDSKKSLYNYLIAFSFKSIIDPIMAEVAWEDPDLINRIKEVALIKLRVIKKYPNIITFTKAMYEGKSFEEIKSMVNEYVPDIYHQLYHRNIDFTLFKEGVDVQKATNTIQWTLEKLSEQYFEQLKRTDETFDLQGILGEVDQYLDMFRKTFYD